MNIIKDLFLTINVGRVYPTISLNEEFIIYIKNNKKNIRNLYKYIINDQKEVELTNFQNNIFGFILVGNRYIMFNEKKLNYVVNYFKYDLEIDKIININNLKKRL